MKTKFSAGWNMAGYLPEMEPALFDTQAEAEAFIAEAKAEYADSLAECAEADFGLDTESDPYEYWVEVVVLDDCPFCETGAATVSVWQAAPMDDTMACEDCASVSLPR